MRWHIANAAPRIQRRERVLAGFEPDIIYAHDQNDRHQDHRIVSELTWNTFRNHLILEYEIPKWDGDMGMPNIFMTIERAVANEKIKVL